MRFLLGGEDPFWWTDREQVGQATPLSPHHGTQSRAGISVEAGYAGLSIGPTRVSLERDLDAELDRARALVSDRTSKEKRESEGVSIGSTFSDTKETYIVSSSQSPSTCVNSNSAMKDGNDELRSSASSPTTTILTAALNISPRANANVASSASEGSLQQSSETVQSSTVDADIHINYDLIQSSQLKAILSGTAVVRRKSQGTRRNSLSIRLHFSLCSYSPFIRRFRILVCLFLLFWVSH